MQTQINEKTFVGQVVYVGIDFHLKNWNVTILCGDIEHKNFSQNPDSQLLASYLKRTFPGAIYKAVYEAGFSGFEACRELNSLGVECMVIHAADVPTTSKERLQKCDKTDSRKLAKSLRSKDFAGVAIPDRELEADRALVRQRNRVSKELARNKNRIKSLFHQFSIKIPERFGLQQTRTWSKPYIEWLRSLTFDFGSLKQTVDNYIQTVLTLRKDLLMINKQIRILSQSTKYHERYNLLTSIPGIGLIAGMNILLQLDDINRFKTLDELCSYVGLAPKMYGSGERMVTGKLIKRGRKDIKILLIEIAWVAIRADPALMIKYQELTKTRNGNKAIIKIAKKILSRIRYVLKNKTTYTLSVVK
jgi:transposase